MYSPLLLKKYDLCHHLIMIVTCIGTIIWIHNVFAKIFRLIICIIIILVICDPSIILISLKEYNVINYPKKMLND